MSENPQTDREGKMEMELTGREDLQSFEIRFLRKLQEHGHLIGYQLVLRNGDQALEYVLQPLPSQRDKC